VRGFELPSIAKNMFRVFIGIMVAVCIPTFAVTYLGMEGQLLPLMEFFKAFGFVFGVLLLCLIFPSLVFASIAEFYGIRAVWVYALGGPISMSVIVLIANWRLLLMWSEIGVIVLGVISGITYWLIAGRYAGLWKRPVA
jgi:hypothetical protein